MRRVTNVIRILSSRPILKPKLFFRGTAPLKKNESKANDSDFNKNSICSLMYWCVDVTVCIEIQSNRLEVHP